MTAVDVDALDKLREAATAGPWEVDGRCGPVMGAAILPPYGYSETPVVALDAGVIRQADAALIVAAVNALEPLLAEVRRGRALREAVEGLADDLDSYVAARGKPKTGTYDDGLNRAQAATATDLRVILDPT